MFPTGFFFAFVGAATAATEGMRKHSRGRSELRSGCFCVFAGIYEMPATEGMRSILEAFSEKCKEGFRRRGDCELAGSLLATRLAGVPGQACLSLGISFVIMTAIRHHAKIGKVFP